MRLYIFILCGIVCFHVCMVECLIDVVGVFVHISVLYQSDMSYMLLQSSLYAIKHV